MFDGNPADASGYEATAIREKIHTSRIMKEHVYDNKNRFFN